MSDAWADGSSYAWRRVRAQVLLDANYLCAIKLKGVCVGHATEVHHTIGRAVTGLDRRYLVAACRPCNARIGDPSHNTVHAKVVGWIRGRGPTTARAIAAQFDDVSTTTLRMILKRAVERGELTTIGAKLYRRGPTDLAKDPQPQFEPRTKW